MFQRTDVLWTLLEQLIWTIMIRMLVRFLFYFLIFLISSMHIFIVQRIDLDFRSMRYISIMIQLHFN